MRLSTYCSIAHHSRPDCCNFVVASLIDWPIKILMHSREMSPTRLFPLPSIIGTLIGAPLFRIGYFGLALFEAFSLEGQIPAQAEEASHLAQPTIHLLNEYCTGCHNAKKTKGKINLEALIEANALGKDFKAWELIVCLLYTSPSPRD